MDPRNYQIVALSTFIVFGVVGLDFNILLPNAVAIIGVAVLTQSCLFSISRTVGHSLSSLLNDAKSALISALSLVLRLPH